MVQEDFNPSSSEMASSFSFSFSLLPGCKRREKKNKKERLYTLRQTIGLLPPCGFVLFKSSISLLILALNTMGG